MPTSGSPAPAQEKRGARCRGAGGVMKSSIASTDSLVEEYLVYRGFTQAFRSFSAENKSDKTKSFEVARIVDQTFSYIHSFEIDSFVTLWSFLNQRFFLHLDQEYTNLSEQIKGDLLKYYLVVAKKKNPEKIQEFFAAYSHEILSESDAVMNLRKWYVLPYISEPDKDADFAAYFSQRWADVLRISLQNLLSVVMKTAPTPKLILLDRWYSSEAQEMLRAQVRESVSRIEDLASETTKQKDRLRMLQTAVRNLVLYVYRHTREQEEQESGSDDEELNQGKMQGVRESGRIACLIADACVEKGGGEKVYNAVEEAGAGSSQYSSIISSLSTMPIEEVETQMILRVEEWIRNMSS